MGIACVVGMAMQFRPVDRLLGDFVFFVAEVLVTRARASFDAPAMRVASERPERGGHSPSAFQPCTMAGIKCERFIGTDGVSDCRTTLLYIDG